MKLKRCTRCHVEKSVDMFTRHKSSPDGFTTICRACQQIANAKAKAKIRGASQNA